MFQFSEEITRVATNGTWVTMMVKRSAGISGARRIQRALAPSLGAAGGGARALGAAAGVGGVWGGPTILGGARRAGGPAPLGGPFVLFSPRPRRAPPPRGR